MPPPLSIIEVIHGASIGVSISRRIGILNITPQQIPEAVNCLGKKLKLSREKIAFDDNNFKGFLIKRVMID